MNNLNLCNNLEAVSVPPSNLNPQFTISESPRMSEEEILCLEKWIPKAANVLEFGAGASTKFFFKKGAYKVFSVESDLSWLHNITEDPFCQHFIKKERLFLYHGDIGAVGHWGFSRDEANVSWLNYHQKVWAELSIEPDFALVDGRFRVACILQILLRCERIPVFVHDFWDREYYHAVLEFVDVLDSADTAAVLSAKENNDWRQISLLLQQYQFVQD